MTREELMVCVASILTTLAEEKDGWSPQGILYVAIQIKYPHFGLSEWTRVKIALQSMGAVDCGSDTMTITDKGRELAAEIEAVISKGSADASV